MVGVRARHTQRNATRGSATASEHRRCRGAAPYGNKGSADVIQSRRDGVWRPTRQWSACRHARRDDHETVMIEAVARAPSGAFEVSVRRWRQAYATEISEVP
jgi:hypothetical protein